MYCIFISTSILIISSCVLSQSHPEKSCSSVDGCSNSFENNYNKDQNSYFGQIEESLAKFSPCNTTNCNCYTSVIQADLEPFKNGITQSMISSIEDRGTKYKIINHKLFRQKACLFPARCSGVEYFLKENLKMLPNMEMIINCRDWPQINRNWGVQGPVLSFSKTDDYLDIMYPTWSFWEGGPAISLYPTGLGRWDKHRESIAKSSNEFPWNKKQSIAFFRGSRTSHERDSLILLSRNKSDLVDAQFTKNQAWKSLADTLNAAPAPEISLEEHCKYKYLFNFRGVAASFRFKHLFLCKSLVFHVGDEWKEFFYSALQPWVHYVPVVSNPTIEELENVISFFKNHDTLAKEIADRGFSHIWDNLDMKNVNCYWRKLLKRYAKLLKYEIEYDDQLIQI